ncbi:Aste57867_16103 [Aphanomyces stellatus]|uniref:Aste57867_16103 protein n=1 Tax=Aphanomyces stellatus TaxID=120398 RepID=A0A485L4Z5_9STRA|nr:hypothetical protein As57867_016047 [Aphanomyces stellatus]VFT92886.1 Aste57867_16103 [Aphanomyces stellatus]
MAVEKTAKGKKILKDDQPESEEKSPPPSSNAVKKPKKPQSSSLWIVLLVGLAAIGAGAAYGATKYTVEDLPASVRSLLGVNESSVPAHLFRDVGDKYQSEIVKINTRKLLSPDASCAAPQVLSEAKEHVETALGHVADLRAADKVFLALNGRDDGVYVHWTKATGCLHALAATAAAALGADPDYFPNGLRLYDSMGEPIVTADQLDAARIAYILIDFQVWVWPGIRVGYTRVVENVKMTTISLSPLVFDTEGFFTLDEANAIIQHGMDKLTRSPVDSPEAQDGYHSDRTSHTAFLSDTQFTRNFRVRTANLARLPSPSFVERMQLVRYEAGQFFRKHEDYFSSKSFLGKKEIAVGQFKAWSNWAAAAIVELDDPSQLPPAFHPETGAAFPKADDTHMWQVSVLEFFLEDHLETAYFADHADQAWADWLKENVENKATGIVDTLLQSKAYMLPDIIASWEKRVVEIAPSLHYTLPKEPPSAVSHYFRWLRWAKERVDDLGTQAPVHVRTDGKDYPSYKMAFQNRLVLYILKDHAPEQLVAVVGQEWADWLETNKDALDVLLDAMKTNPIFFDLAVAAWTKRAGPGLFDYDKPAYLQHFEPNRYVTLFLYLNDVDEGGETVFPHSKERLVTDIAREGMDECSEGLAVPPLKLHASLFYAQTPENLLDPLSLHGGCPPAQGVKFGANSFTWNADADEGSACWGF